MSTVLEALDALLSELPQVSSAELDAHGTYAALAVNHLRPLVEAVEEEPCPYRGLKSLGYDPTTKRCTTNTCLRCPALDALLSDIEALKGA
jgi:hypothetical protein